MYVLKDYGRWMIDNNFARTDSAVKPDKKSTESIDGAVATIMTR